MQIIVGNKQLNLEELYNIACNLQQTQVVIDNQIANELSNTQSQQNQQIDFPELIGLQLTQEHERAILAVKLLQLLKLKKNSTKQTTGCIVNILNNHNSQISSDTKQFFQGLFEIFNNNKIYPTDKECFILLSTTHVYQSIITLEVYKLSQQTRLFDAILAFSLETLKLPADFFSEYCLTLGKQSQGVTQFKNNILALTDKSKMISTQKQQQSKDLLDRLQIPKVYTLHGNLQDKLFQLKQQMQNEIHSEFGMLFSEKKYKDMMYFAKQQEKDQIDLLTLQVQQLTTIIDQMCYLSDNRENVLQISGQMKDGMSVDDKNRSVIQIFETLKSNKIFDAYAAELYSCFSLNKNVEDKMKENAKSEKKEEEDQKQKKKKSKEQVTQLQFGKGTRQLFDYLLAIQQEKIEEFYNKIDILRNNELNGLLEELLQQRNEERRRPKCAKGTRDMNPLQMSIREKAFNIIREVFKKHGASEIDTPVFELKETLMGKYGEESKLIYDLEDQGGELLSLRYDLTVPFARYVAEKNLASIKRFHIAKVYRRDNPQMSKGRFREFYQCDFDIAGTYSIMIPDAEVIKVVVEILSQLDIGNFIVKINHRKFLDAIVELSGCEKRKFKTICSSIDKLDKEPWEKVKEELIQVKGLTEDMCNKLGKFVEYKGKPKQLLQTLIDDKVFENHQEGTSTIQEMHLLFSYLEAMNALDNVQFDFSLARGLDYYTGLIYEAILTYSDKVGSIAGGGRYDGLVGMFSSKSIPAVGVSIGIERIFAILEEKYTQSLQVRATETQILIAQIGKGLVEERLRICNLLWQNQLKAETLYNDNPKTPKQIQYALDNGIPLIMWIGENEMKEGVVKIKSLNKHEEYTVKNEDIVEKVQQLVQENPILLPQDQQENKEEHKE